MISMLKNTKVSVWQIISAILLLAIGDWLALSGIHILSPLSIFLYFIIFGIMALLVVLGWTNTKLLFGRLTLKNLKWIPFAFFGSFLCSIAFSLIGSALNLTSNAHSDGDMLLDDISMLEKGLNLVVMGFSLAGEEIYIAAMFTIVAIVMLKQMNKKQALIVSAIVVMSIFGLTHLSVYEGNVYQCLFIIGLGHLPSMYAFLKSKTLWVPIIAHILYDFAIFFFVAFALSL